MRSIARHQIGVPGKHSVHRCIEQHAVGQAVHHIRILCQELVLPSGHELVQIRPFHRGRLSSIALIIHRVSGKIGLTDILDDLLRLPRLVVHIDQLLDRAVGAKADGLRQAEHRRLSALR